MLTNLYSCFFVGRIGGHPNSFNCRKTWPKKVKLIMDKVGLVKLTDDIYFKNENFNNAWGKTSEQ